VFSGEWVTHKDLYEIILEYQICQITKLTPTHLTCIIPNEISKTSSYLFQITKGNSAVHTISVTSDQPHILSKRSDPETNVYKIDPVAATGGLLNLYGQNPALFYSAEIEGQFYLVSYSGKGDLFQVYIEQPMKEYTPSVILHGPSGLPYASLDFTFLRKWHLSTIPKCRRFCQQN
jgi:hypothetical protein